MTIFWNGNILYILTEEIIISRLIRQKTIKLVSINIDFSCQNKKEVFPIIRCFELYSYHMFTGIVVKLKNVAQSKCALREAAPEEKAQK